MPTNANAYNSRITDESLEKKFRDSFRSQGGAELVDDLYASGVIVPVIDFSAAASGSTLAQNLQTAFDFSVTSKQYTSTTISPVLVNTAGFWLLWGNNVLDSGVTSNIYINDGSSQKYIQRYQNGATLPDQWLDIGPYVVYLRSGDSLEATTTAAGGQTLFLATRQIADVSGDLINPTGFTSS